MMRASWGFFALHQSVYLLGDRSNGFYSSARSNKTINRFARAIAEAHWQTF
jgi:hypothetical protein